MRNLGVRAACQKTEGSDIDACHGFVEIAQACDGMKHGAIATDDRGHIDMMDEFRCRNATASASESSAAVIQQGFNSCLAQRLFEFYQSGDRTGFEWVDEDS
jgi:hypothetical protein